MWLNNLPETNRRHASPLDLESGSETPPTPEAVLFGGGRSANRSATAMN
jgi:hypothetical protein